MADLYSPVDETEHLPAQPPPGGPDQGWLGAIAHYFKFAEQQTTFRTEILAGMTTFMTMAYILVVNPLILGNAIFLQQSGDLFAELAVATAISAAIGTLAMAFLANYPFCLAPGMGINAFFAFSVVLTLKIDWRLALSCVLAEGVIFILLTVFDIRRQIIKAIPETLKSATGAGIGLFIAYIGLSGDPKVGGAGLILPNPVTKTALGQFHEPVTLMATVGIIITSAFILRRIKGALLWGILATALLGWILGITPWPQGIVELPPWPKDLVGQAFTGFTQLNAQNWLDFLAAMLVFLFVDIFDTIGTLSGVGKRAGFIDANGELPRANQALMADAIATTVGAVLGTSTVTTYVESASGVAEGGRTGFTAVVTGLLLGVSVFFIPLFRAIPPYATTSALVIVGVLMMANVLHIRWGDLAEAIPAFLVMFMIPLSYSIAEGLAIGFIAYPICKSLQGKGREVPIATWVITGIFILRFVFMALRFDR